METIRASSSALGLLVFFMSVLTLLFASVIYLCEEGTFKVTAQYPDGAYFRQTLTGDGEEVSPFSSIPVAAYYVMCVCCVGVKGVVCVCGGVGGAGIGWGA
jgi:hypothetical protein